MATQGYNKNSFNPPDTIARTSHSLSIVYNSQRIGLINQWSPQQSRDVSPIYELNVETSGLPLENIPGNVKGLQVSVNRYDIWVKRMEEVFGSTDLVMLSFQNAPFSVVEEWTNPNGSIEAYEYSGCWFTSLGRAFRSDDDRKVNVNATLVYVFKRKIS
jgi:hypothetical protein